MSKTLASLLLIDQLQPATAALLTATSRIGTTLAPGRSLLLFEIQPTGVIEEVADIVFESIDADPAIFQLDGRVSYLGVTSPEISELRSVAQTVIARMGFTLPTDPGTLIGATRVSNLSEPHAHLNRVVTHRDVLQAGQTLLTLECLPAPLAIRAMNEAEKAANFTAVDIRFTGSMGRFKIAGEDEEIRTAQQAACKAVEEGP